MSDSKALLQELTQVADCFCERTGGASLKRWPSGAEGLRNLAGVLDQACERIDAGEEDEEQLVEQSGALFAQLLVGALAAKPIRTEGHIVLRVGDFGCFDPFDAVRHALDAEWPSEALREEVARAEAEAEGAGPHARVVRELVRQVHEQSPFRFVSCDAQTVYFSDSLEVVLSPLLRVCAGESKESVRASVSRVVRSIPRQGAEVFLWREAAARVFPRLVSAPFAEQMSRRGLVFDNFVGDLKLAYVVQDGKMVRYLRQKEVPHRDANDLRRCAVDNLEARSIKVRVRSYSQDPRAAGMLDSEIHQLTYGDGFDASRLVLPALSTALTERFGPSFHVAVPHRDALLVAESGAERSLGQLVEGAFCRAPHALSRALYYFDSNGKLAWH